MRQLTITLIGLLVATCTVEAGEFERWCFDERGNEVYRCEAYPPKGIWSGPKEQILRMWMEKQPHFGYGYVFTPLMVGYFHDFKRVFEYHRATGWHKVRSDHY